MLDFQETRPAQVLIIPVNYAGEVLCTPGPAHTLELPTGDIAPDADPAQAAKRALQQATGFSAEAWFPLGVIASGGRDVHLFLARNLAPARSMGAPVFQQDATTRAAFEDLENLIAAGRLRDAAVIAALFIARQAVAGKFSPGSEDTGHA